jgi:hypothetical protein
LVTLRFRAHNALLDLGDRLRGRCCRAPLFMVDGGYHFWRCMLRRGHDGPCRSGNYLWGPGGSVYAPIDKWPRGRWDRKPVQTRRQAESCRRWHDLSEAKRAGEAKATDGGDW